MVEAVPTHSICSNCGSTLNTGAKFCHECGTSSGKTKSPAMPNIKLILAVGFLMCSGIAALAYLYSSDATNETGTQLFNPSPTAQSTSSIDALQQRTGNNVDLSTMSPRQAADRLFNRVMMAYESGDTAQVDQFAPMAQKAYQLVTNLDADAYYHLGLLGLALNDEDELKRQVKKLESESPNHLLALALEYKLAMSVGDNEKATDVLSRIREAYDIEMVSLRPEYEAHKITIDKLYAAAKNNISTN